MFLKYLLGQTVFRDETDGEADGGGADRGDEFEVDETEDEEVESEAAKKKDDEETDEDDEKSEDEDSESKKKAEKKDDKKSKMVPHARMKEAVEKERRAREAAEKKAQEAEQQLKDSQRGVDLDKLNTEIEDLEDKLDAAIADGDNAAKKQIRKELRDKQMTLARAEAAALSAQATAIAVERVRYDALVARLETEHPVMNPDSDEYDEAVIAEIVDLKESFEAKGQSSTDALAKAAKYVLKGAAKPAKKDEEEEDEVDDEKKREAEEKRREEAVRRAAEVKKRQPPNADKSGKTSDKSGGGLKGNVNKLSDDEFDKLDPKELARLRGDEV